MKIATSSSTLSTLLLLFSALFHATICQELPSDFIMAMNGHIPWENTTRLAPVSTNDKVIKFAVAGDIMMGRTVANTIEENGNDFTLPFKNIKEQLDGVDIKIANLEAQITNSTTVKKRVVPCSPTGSGGCCGLHCHFKTSTRVVEGLSYAGLNLLLLENNHIEDYLGGREDTIDALNSHHMPWTDANHPFQISNYKGCNLSFINYDTVLYGHTAAKIKRRIEADLKNVEPTSFKTVLIHGGREYAYDETEKQRELAFAAIDDGADIVIFSHAHVVLGYETYKDKWIFWGLGNFVFDQFFNARVKEFLMIKFDLLNCKQVANLQLVGGEITKLNQPTAANFQTIESTIVNLDPPKPRLIFTELSKPSKPIKRVCRSRKHK